MHARGWHNAANLKPLHGPWPNNAVCSFIQDNCGEELSPLFAGELYHSRSVLFLPGYFDELEHRYPTEFAGIFEAFAEPWHEEATSPSATRCAGLTRTAPAP